MLGLLTICSALETYESDTSYIESLLNVKTSQGSLNATNIRIAAGLGPVLLGVSRDFTLSRPVFCC